MHQAAGAGHEAVVRLLVERGARLDMKDILWQGTPAGWAEYGGKTEMAAYLREQEAKRKQAPGKRMRLFSFVICDRKRVETWSQAETESRWAAHAAVEVIPLSR